MSTSYALRPFTGEEREIIRRVIRFDGLPYNPFRETLYTVKELMAGYPGETLDQRIAEHYNLKGHPQSGHVGSAKNRP